MKQLLIIPILMLAACASHRPQKPAPVASVPLGRAVSADGLRTGEQLREYRFGRYVEPGDPQVMHENHPVYRVEAVGDWNLEPGSATQSRARTVVNVPSAATNDAVLAEVNKQRAATRAITEQTATLNQRLAEMTQAAAQSQELVRQTVALKRDMAALQERLNSLDARVGERKSAAADRTPPRLEDKW